MLPYLDENPSRTRPYWVWVFVAANLAVALYGALAAPDYVAWLNRWGLKAASFWSGAPPGEPSPWLALFASAWLHAGFLHLAGNLWFLWLFGDNVEDQLGHGRFVAFYLICGLLAALTQVIVAPHSTLPLVGASGAIAGVLAAYLRFFPLHRVRAMVLVVIFIYRIRVPAFFFIILWLLVQVLGQLTWARMHGQGGGVGGVAYGAHLGGFVAGLLLAGPFSHGRPPPRKPPPPEVF